MIKTFSVYDAKNFAMGDVAFHYGDVMLASDGDSLFFGNVNAF